MDEPEPIGGDVRSGGAGRWLGRTLPRLLVELAGIVFAVIVALAADEWRDNRELRQRAETALDAVLAELRANRDELERTRGGLDESARQVEEAVGAVEAGRSPSLSVMLELPDFSDAAWRITQVTDAAARLEFDWLTRVARVYAAQELYAEVRGEVVRTLGTLGAARGSPGLAQLRSQLGIMLQLHRQLIEDYDAVLAENGS